MQKKVTERTILAPLALIIVAALATLPLAVILAGREVEHMANEGLGGVVGQMFASHLDRVADSLARDLSDPQSKTTPRVVIKPKHEARWLAMRATSPDLDIAQHLSRRLGHAPNLSHANALVWRGERPVMVVAIRGSAAGETIVRFQALKVEDLRRDFAAPLELPDFAIAPTGASGFGRNAMPIKWGDQARAGVITWKRDRSGDFLIEQMAPMVAFLIAVIAGSAFVLMGRARRLAHGVLVAQARAEHLALHDPMTGVANRLLFMQNLEVAIARHRREHAVVGVLMIDLDRFKQVNDTLGHQAGDDLIVETARRLKATCRAEDTVARFGGDEFAIVASAAHEAGLLALADRLVEALQGQVAVRGGQALLSGSVGLAIMEADVPDSTELLRRADQALYEAKRAGRGQRSAYCAEISPAGAGASPKLGPQAFAATASA